MDILTQFADLTKAAYNLADLETAGYLCKPEVCQSKDDATMVAIFGVGEKNFETAGKLAELLKANGLARGALTNCFQTDFSQKNQVCENVTIGRNAKGLICLEFAS